MSTTKKIIIRKEFVNEYKLLKKDVKTAISQAVLSRNSFDFQDVSQASACDLFITACLKSNDFTVDEIKKLVSKDAKTLNKLFDLLTTYQVTMRDKTQVKDVYARIVRHMTSDTIKRLEKRMISLT